MHDRLAVAVFAAERGMHLTDPPPKSSAFEVFLDRFDSSRYLMQLAENDIRWVDRYDPEFPAVLRPIHNSPPGLFVRGSASLEQLCVQPAVAVVGARACSSYGAAVAHKLGVELAQAGVVVVSGLARGVDAAVHRGVLESEGPGFTVAVLGCGIDRNYPTAHSHLASLIAASGLIVSEYPPGVEPAPWRFPARNRIIAGLCKVTVVVEARERSGALITADLALDEDREVMAVPGEITSLLSYGTNALLRVGAAPVTCTADVLDTLGVAVPA